MDAISQKKGEYTKGAIIQNGDSDTKGTSRQNRDTTPSEQTDNTRVIYTEIYHKKKQRYDTQGTNRQSRYTILKEQIDKAGI